MIETTNPLKPGEKLIVHPWAHTDLAYYFQDSDGGVWKASDAVGTSLRFAYRDFAEFEADRRFDAKTNEGGRFPNLVWDYNHST